MKRLQLIFISLSALILTSCDFQQESADLQWRGPNRDGIFNENNLLDAWPEEGPELLWKYEELGRGHSSAVFGDDKVFTLGTNLKDSITSLFAFSLEGELLWKKEMGTEWMKSWPAERGTPLIYDGKGYVLDGLGVMHCFSIVDGSSIWKRALIGELTDRNSMHGVHENLVIEGDKLFCTLGGEEHNILALNRNTGETIWTSTGTGRDNAYCSPTVIEHGGKKYYITMTYNELISIDVENGNVAWTQKLSDEKHGIHASVPLYRDGMLFIIEGYRFGSKMYKIADDGLSSKLLWMHDTIGPQMGDAVRINEDVFVSSSPNKNWYSIDWTTGDINFSTKKLGTGTIVAADNKLFIQTYRGRVAMVKVENNDFTILGELQAPTRKGDHYAQPVIKDGKLYIRYMDTMCVYDIRKKS
jgi:outer membrane protein assembly factor BamB